MSNEELKGGVDVYFADGDDKYVSLRKSDYTPSLNQLKKPHGFISTPAGLLDCTNF